MYSGVLYYNVGTKHLVRMLVSLYSLRKVYKGPVAVIDGDEERNALVTDIAKKFTAEVIHKPTRRYARHSAYVGKASLWRHVPFEVSLYLDSDTVVLKPVVPLLEAITRSCGFVATHFSDWQSKGVMMSGRIQKWLSVGTERLDVRTMVKESLARPIPAVNTGVFGFRSDSKFLSVWEELTREGKEMPWTDELACQLLLTQERVQLVEDEWNWSPIYGKAEDPRIVHFHGSKHVERETGRGSQGHKIWWPIFEEVLAENLAGVREWMPNGDRQLGKYLKRINATPQSA